MPPRRMPAASAGHPRGLVTRQETLRQARLDAEEPTLRDPLLDARRILVLAQRLAAEQINGPAAAPPTGDQAAREA
jgi:hypothetical protein